MNELRGASCSIYCSSRPWSYFIIQSELLVADTRAVTVLKELFLDWISEIFGGFHDSRTHQPAFAWKPSPGPFQLALPTKAMEWMRAHFRHLVSDTGTENGRRESTTPSFTARISIAALWIAVMWKDISITLSSVGIITKCSGDARR